jgi:photosystem II stability/assembly factor-like uncharacterized protein
MVLTGCSAQYSPAHQAIDAVTPAVPDTAQADPAVPAPVQTGTTTIQHADQPDYTPAPAAGEADSSPAAPVGTLTVKNLRLFGSAGWMQTADKLYHTADGGKTWTDVTPKVSPLQGAQYVSGTEAWIASSGVLMHTRDGGNLWLTNKASFVNSFMSFVGANGFAMVPDSPGAGNEPVQIYATHDNGGGWSLLAGSVPTSGIKTGIAFADTDHGWVTATSYAPGQPRVYATHDAGSSWQQLQLPVEKSLQNSQFTVEAPVVLSSTKIILPAQVFTADAGSITVFYTTEDGGHNWTASAGLPGTGAYAFSPDGHGWFFDGKGLEATTDGGHTWSPLNTSPTMGDVEAISFASATEGLAVNHGSLLRTTDGGHTWAPAQVR